MKQIHTLTETQDKLDLCIESDTPNVPCGNGFATKFRIIAEQFGEQVLIYFVAGVIFKKDDLYLANSIKNGIKLEAIELFNQ